MAVSKQAALETLDLSERLRFVMTMHKLSVSELAANAGVSKSAMEKYLSGPSVPRATAIASLCIELGINAEWLLFGRPDNDLRLVRRESENGIVALLNELKQPGTLSENFAKLGIGTSEWRKFTWEVGNERAVEIANRVANARIEARKQEAAGIREVRLDDVPFRGMSEAEFQANRTTDDDR
ncbi:helix-turn-helix domain protein [mine drainage metagenome]|uniref:Helix-turn-helix domain protein n=1 Tax=mine drainage metagenome TaxID=410659 RepID=A0A1J5PK35_9ZZZZ